MLINVYTIVASGSFLWEFRVLLQLGEELTNPAGVLGRHLHKCHNDIYSSALFWGHCETQVGVG